MMKALEYFYRIKQHPIDKTKGCGIIPYVYNQAYKYYYNLWLAQEQNKTKDFNDYIPKDIVVKITSPERKPERRRLFTFLEEDDVNAE